MKKQNVFVRSIYDLGDYNDDEINTLPSMTDPSQDEPIEALVARMLRGEMVGGGMPQFDTDSELDSDSVYRLQAETSKDGFDLSDIPAITKRGLRAAKALKKGEGTPPPVEPVPAPPAAPVPPPAAK